MGRLVTATRVLRDQGVAGVLSALKDRYLDNWAGRSLDWCYGKALELKGDVVEIDGCTFSLESPAITTTSKSKFMFNRYERPERDAVRRFVDPGVPVVEFGGALGVIACVTNRKLSEPERHVVVEANPQLVPLLLRNRDRNRCRFTVLPRVIAYGWDRVPFYADRGNFVIGTAVRAEGSEPRSAVEVETTNLRSIVEEYRFDSCTLVCDIEGGEEELIRYEADILSQSVMTLILEVHEWILGEKRVGELLRQIAKLGFKTVGSDGDTYTFRKGK